ncbi:MAG: CCA tRNA nucleotidyltransferase [Thaumarchaeota archaeon]|nr:CCA tRNA nucleotidyltransferase [Nitrososphaerota archaeon]
MQKYDLVLKAARRLAEPSPKEQKRLTGIANYALKRVEKVCMSKKLPLKPLLAGSFAKGTWIAGDADIDIFVKAPALLTKEELGKLGIEIGKAALRGHGPYMRYSEHPYVEAWVRGVKVNVVACYDVPKGEWMSAADRSPYHTELIRERFDDAMRSEARLLKRFLKGLGIYGAEIKTKGFSGYVTEVLILKFGTFLDTLRGISNVKFGDSIVQSDLDKPFAQLHDTPIIILDPVDPRRNLGAAISKQKVAEFILGASLFLERPSIKYFEFRRPVPIPKKAVLSNVAIVTFRHKERTVDKLWGQLNKSILHLEKHLIDQNFRVLRSIAASDDKKESAFVFLLEGIQLPDQKARIGPETSFSSDSLKFIEANKNRSDILFVGGDGRVYSLGNRGIRTAKDAFSYLLDEGIETSGISAGLQDEVRKTERVMIGTEISKFAQKRNWLKEAVAEVATTSKIIACCS